MLEEDYYLANFRYLVEFVADAYAGLLNDAELRWHCAFMGSPEPAQRLYVRLANRRADVFRLSKLKYPEIKSLVEASTALCTAGLANAAPPSDIDVLLQRFTKPELIKQLALHGMRQRPRAELVALIKERDLEPDKLCLQGADRWITLAGLDEYAVFRLCFFGNGYQDMSEFVLRDLGVFKYAHYRIDEHSRVFQSRQQLDAHLQYFACASLFGELDQSDVQALLQIDQALPEISAFDSHLTRRVERLRNSIARQLERLSEAELALQLYGQSARPPSRERQIRLLMKLERYDAAFALWTDMKQGPRADEEMQFVETIMPKLYKQLALPVPKRVAFKPVTNKLTLTESDARVEIIAKDFYAQFGDCFYVENSLINGVLGLFIWDIIFAPVEGVFYNPFQSAPADFYQKEFTEKRQSLLMARFAELDDPLRFSARVWAAYEAHQGTMNPLVNWPMVNEDLLSLALIRIPVADWRALFNRILSDIRHHSSGLPDLILFPANGTYELIEIKGPGDAVQKNQRRWMAYFAQHRIPYRVVHIRWAGQRPRAQKIDSA